MTMKWNQYVLGQALFAVLSLWLTNTAEAAAGLASGNLLFYQNQGSFCPFGRDCTGAKYTWLDFNTNEPLRDARVYVVRQSDGVILGQSTTDVAGFFTIAWSDPSVGPFTPTAARLEFRGQHGDGRFALADAFGGAITPLSQNFIANPGFTWLAFVTFGTAAAPNDLANLYDGAQMMWQNSLSQSLRMILSFTGLTIRAYDWFTCPSSCANGPTNTIIIDSVGAAYNPQSRILHEMGHIANYRANTNWQQIGGFNYSFGGAGGWNLDSAEFESAGWEEAVATHGGDVALYFPNATQPHTCFASAAACTAGTFNIETTGNCAAVNSNRIVVNHIRYHWDNYDVVPDSLVDLVSEPVSAVWDAIANFPNTTGNRGINEFWDATLTAGDDNDGRGTLDFQANWDAMFGGPNTTLILNANCGAAGD